MRLRRFLFVYLAVSSACLISPGTLGATPADTTWVTTFDHDFYNWATPHVETFEFPPAGSLWSEILLYYEIECPGSPADCDPWDRLGHLRVLEEEGPETVPYEIARIITPYDITGGSFPGSCTWVLDVSDYETLLHDSVTLSNYIESWMGNDRGWIVTIKFAFIAGFNPIEPYKVVNLWTKDRVIFGDPEQPIEDELAPINLVIDAEAEATKLRVITTGHGQGNTDNAAEFSVKWHAVEVGNDTYSHTLWRSDCLQNPCSPQGGTWQFNRAGWCPGDKVTPWDSDITSSVTPGQSIVLDHNVEPYTNCCRPNNPSCSSVNCPSTPTCSDCNYNFNGHTEPHYTVQSQLIFYRTRATSGLTAAASSPQAGLQVGQNRPNPFNPTTRFEYSIAAPGDLVIAIYTISGRNVRDVEKHHAAAGSYTFEWDGKDQSGATMPAGVYLYEVRSQGVRGTRKMILLE